MKHSLSFLLFLGAAFGFYFTASAQKEIYSKAKVSLTNSHTIKRLAGLGMECDHGEYKAGQYFISGFSSAEINRIQADGFSVEVLVPDVIKDFQERNAKEMEKAVQANLYPDYCNKVKPRKIPKHWRLGTMGGHLKYEEMLQHLDSMKILYPNLLTTRAAIDTTRTVEGRYIQFVKISDNPNVAEPAEPQALYSALHHAREPVGMHQLIFYMWYLLENYATDPEIKMLVDNSELFFVPCVNPDGYLYNQAQEPQGGALWRKNRRNNGDGTFGIDLNRNYGYNWGYDDFGSSPNSQSDTYRGPSAFSEPETRAMKKFTETHNFKIGLNYHTYSNLVIHPWGYESVQPEDSVLFRGLTKEMTRENNYRIGTAMEVLNYNSNGSSDDFMYSDQPGKPKIYAMTPEVGNSFWPLQTEILDLCLKNVHQNLTVARALQPLVSFRDSTGVFTNSRAVSETGGIHRLRYKLQKSLVNPTDLPFTLTFTPLQPNTFGLTPVTKTYNTSQLTPNLVDSIILSITTTMNQSELVKFESKLTVGNFTSRDTIGHFLDGWETETDHCDNLNNWTGNWIVNNTDQMEGNGCFTDSDGDYLPDMEKEIWRTTPFKLDDHSWGLGTAEMTFWTRYAIEKNYDYAQVQLSVDSGATWENTCTDFTVFSSPFSQQAGNDIIPIWDGFLSQWRRESIDLTPYYNSKKIWVKFKMISDAGSEFDGMYIDKIEIKRTKQFIISVGSITDERKPSLSVFPNPSSGPVTVRLTDAKPDAKVQIFNILGKLEKEKMLDGSAEVQWTESFTSGSYFATYQDSKGNFLTQRWVVR